MTVFNLKALDRGNGINECRGESSREGIDNNLVPEYGSLNGSPVTKGIGIGEIPGWRRIQINGGCSNSINHSNRTIVDDTLIDGVVEECKQRRRLVLWSRIENGSDPTDTVNEGEIAVLNGSRWRAIRHLTNEFELDITGLIGSSVLRERYCS